MKDIKMSDVFDLPLATSKGDVLIDSKGLHIAYSCDHEAIALAVNSHDALVEALEEVVFDECVMQEVLGCELFDKVVLLLAGVKK